MAFGGLFWEAGNYSAAIRIIEYKGHYSDGRAILKKIGACDGQVLFVLRKYFP